MTRLPLALLGAVAALALAAGPARAWQPPNASPATSPLVTEVVGIAEGFWTARGLPICPADQLQVEQAPDLSGGMAWERAYGRGEMNGCTIWLLSSLVRKAQLGMPGNNWAVYLCRTATIEIGHTGGLDDHFGAGGVMDPASSWNDGTPWGCRAWAADQRRAFHRAVRRFARIVHSRKRG